MIQTIKIEKVNFARKNQEMCKMVNETTLIGTFFKARQKTIAKYATQADELQNKVLQRLVSRAKCTEWGKLYDYSTVKGYRIFNNVVLFKPTKRLRAMWIVCDMAKKIFYGQVRWYGMLNHQVLPMIRVSLFLSVRKDFRPCIMLVDVMR